MVEQPIISVSGLRGIVGTTLTPDVASHYACALAGELGEGSLVITRDGRASGRMLADAVRTGLTAMGRNVIDADVAATPRREFSYVRCELQVAFKSRPVTIQTNITA